jgi:hypothetical protein
MQVWRNCLTFCLNRQWPNCLPKCHIVYTQLWTAFFIFRSGLARVYCIFIIIWLVILENWKRNPVRWFPGQNLRPAFTRNTSMMTPISAAVRVCACARVFSLHKWTGLVEIFVNYSTHTHTHTLEIGSSENLILYIWRNIEMAWICRGRLWQQPRMYQSRSAQLGITRLAVSHIMLVLNCNYSSLFTYCHVYEWLHTGLLATYTHTTRDLTWQITDTQSSIY